MMEKINNGGRPSLSRILVFLIVFFLISTMNPLSAWSQSAQKIAVIPVKNRSEYPEYTTLCETVTDTVTAVIRYLPDYILVEPTDNPAMLETDIDNLEDIGTLAREYNYSQILFGELVTNSDGKLQFDLQIYDSVENDIIVRESAVSETLLDVFDTADTMTFDLLGQITDVNIGFGTIELIKESGEGEYSVFINGRLIRNPAKTFRQVLNGSYILDIQQERLQGPTTIYSAKIYVNEFQTTTVKFSIPRATESEKEYLELMKQELADMSQDPEKIDIFLEKVAEFQEQTRNLDYDPSLNDEKTAIINEAEEQASRLLNRMMEEADSHYYARKPDFDSAEALYSRITDLISDTFTFSTADPGNGETLSEPWDICVTDEGSFYVLDNRDSPEISFFNSEGVLQDSRPLRDITKQSKDVSLAVNSEGVCFLAPAGSSSIYRFGRELDPVTELTVPGFSPDENQPLLCALSRDGVVYLLTSDMAAVFEFSIGTAIEVERDSLIENALIDGVQRIPGLAMDALFFDSSNRLNVFSGRNEKIYRFTPLGEPEGEVTLSGSSRASGIASDELGFYYAVLPDENIIVKYSPGGDIVTSFGGEGSGLKEFSSPSDLDIDEEGNLYVADTRNGRIQMLELSAPPLVLPDVARFGSQFARREQSAEAALEKLGSTSSTAGRTFFSGLWYYGFPFLLTSTAPLFAFLDSMFYSNAMYSYDEYRNTTNGDDAVSEWNSYVFQTLFSRASLLAGYGVTAAGSYLFASRLAESIDNSVSKKRTIRQLQLLDMDKEYELNPERFRSLKTARTLGIVTGIVPPLVGGSAYLLMSMFPGVSPMVKTGISAGLNLVPPVFSHAYSGKVSWGALITGFIADGLAAAAFAFSEEESRSEYMSGYTDPVDRAEAYSGNSGPGYLTSELLYIASTAFRLAAGIQDARGGWVSANDYNTYQAVEETERLPDVRVSPILDENSNPGIVVGINY